MRSPAPIAVLLTAVAVLSASAAAKPRIVSRVVVRAYDSLGLSDTVLGNAQLASADILQQASLQASWRNCRMARGPASASADLCQDVLADDEVIIRIVSAPKAFQGPDAPFGYSLVNPDEGEGSLATVFGDQILNAAARVRVDAATLLGRAMAHELGHLLLGTADHSASGLMRSVWSDHALVSRAREDWMFSPADLTRLRLALSFDSSSIAAPLR